MATLRVWTVEETKVISRRRRPSYPVEEAGRDRQRGAPARAAVAHEDAEGQVVAVADEPAVPPRSTALGRARLAGHARGQTGVGGRTMVDDGGHHLPQRRDR